MSRSFRAAALGGASLLIFFLATAPAQPAAQPAAEPPYDWDLEGEYPNEGAWNTALAAVRERLARFESRRSAPMATVEELADRLDEVRWLRGQAGRMARFAILHTEVDQRSQAAKTRLDAATQLEARVEAGVSWLDAAVLKLGPRRLEDWATRERRLRPHRWRLHRLLSAAGHLPPLGAEAAVASLERAAQTSTDVYDALMQADLGWPTVRTADGSELRLDSDGWYGRRRDPDQAARETANRLFLGRLKTLEEPLGVLMTRRLGADLDLAHIRNFASPIDAFFHRGDGLPVGEYKRIARVARAYRETAAREARLIARVHGLSRLELGDYHAPAPAMHETKAFSLEEAIDTAVGAWAAMGADFQQLMRRRLAHPWIDWRPRANKHGGGVYWPAGGVGHPYTVITCDDRLRGSKVFAEAASLMMFYASVPPDKAPERREEDWPVYGNAIWFLGQALHDDYVVRHTSEKSVRVAILYDDVYRLWASYFQFAPFVELQEKVYDSIERGRPLSGGEIATAYSALLGEYYPARDGAGAKDALHGEQALVLGNTYYGQVLAEWAIATAAAVAMAEGLAGSDPKVITALAHPMRARDSFTSYELLRDAGVDLATDAPYEAVFRRMNKLMDALDKELAVPNPGQE